MTRIAQIDSFLSLIGDVDNLGKLLLLLLLSCYVNVSFFDSMLRLDRSIDGRGP